MKTLNTLTDKKSANFEKKQMCAWNTQFGIEVGTRRDWLKDEYSMPGCIKFISKNIDMYAGTQQERSLYIRDAIISKLIELGHAKISKQETSYLLTNSTIEL